MKQNLFLFHLTIFCVFIFAAQSPIIGAGIPNLDKISILDLQTAEHIALADNPSLAAAENRILQAKERILQARSAYLPHADASASYSHAWLSDNASRISGGDDSEDRFGAGLTGTWVLFDGFERNFSLASAQFGEKETRESESNTRRLLLSSVAAAYYNAQLAHENIAIAEADQAFYHQQSGEAEIRRDVGTGSLSDVLSFQIQVNAAKAGLIRAKQSYETAMSGLAAIMGIPDAVFPSDLKLASLESEIPEELVTPEPAPLIIYALANRPDILQSGYAIKMAESGIGLAEAAFFPDLALSASFDGDRKDNPGFESGDFGTTVALTLSYNFFDGGAKNARFREAKLKKSEAEKQKENAELTVASEVREALASLKSAQAQLVLQRSNAGLVRQNRDLVEKEFAAGQSSLVRLNEAQRDLITAQARLATALVSLRQAWYALEVSTGKILSRFEEGEAEG